LVAYYKLDRTSGAVVDEMGNHNGVNYGTTRGVAGKVGNAFDFDGTNQYIATDLSVNDYEAGFTASVWVYADAYLPGQRIISQVESQNWGEFMLGILSSGEVQVAYPYGDNSSTFHIGVYIATGSWNHLTTTHDGNYDKVFINGTEVKSRASKTFVSNTNSMTFGARNKVGYHPYPFDGKIDEVRIYNRALSSAEINSLYQNP